MNKRLGTVLLFALIVSGGASALLYQLIGSKSNAAPVQRTSKVLVAVHTLQAGEIAKKEDVRLIDWAGTIPPGSIHSVNAAIDRGVTAPIYEGEPLVESRLAPKGAGGGLAATIPPGMRAVAVRMNEVVSVSGFVLPGMKVDVIIAGNPPGNNTSTTSKIILQNIEVLSAGQKFQRDTEGKPVSVPVVNLLVTPEQAEILSLAANEMRVQLVLRNPLDKSVAETKGMDVANLFAGAEQRSVPAKGRAVAPKNPQMIARAKPDMQGPVVVEVIEGSKRSEVKLENVKATEQ